MAFSADSARRPSTAHSDKSDVLFLQKLSPHSVSDDSSDSDDSDDDSLNDELFSPVDRGAHEREDLSFSRPQLHKTDELPRDISMPETQGEDRYDFIRILDARVLKIVEKISGQHDSALVAEIKDQQQRHEEALSELKFKIQKQHVDSIEEHKTVAAAKFQEHLAEMTKAIQQTAVAQQKSAEIAVNTLQHTCKHLSQELADSRARISELENRSARAQNLSQSLQNKLSKTQEMLLRSNAENTDLKSKASADAKEANALLQRRENELMQELRAVEERANDRESKLLKSIEDLETRVIQERLKGESELQKGLEREKDRVESVVKETRRRQSIIVRESFERDAVAKQREIALKSELTSCRKHVNSLKKDLIVARKKIVEIGAAGVIQRAQRRLWRTQHCRSEARWWRKELLRREHSKDFIRTKQISGMRKALEVELREEMKQEISHCLSEAVEKAVSDTKSIAERDAAKKWSTRVTIAEAESAAAVAELNKVNKTIASRIGRVEARAKQDTTDVWSEKMKAALSAANEKHQKQRRTIAKKLQQCENSLKLAGDKLSKKDIEYRTSLAREKELFLRAEDQANEEILQLRLELASIKEEKENEIELLRSSHVKEIEKLEQEARRHLRLFESECANPEDQKVVTLVTHEKTVTGAISEVHNVTMSQLRQEMDSTVKALKLNHARTLGRLLSQLADARSEILQVKKQHGNMLHRYKSISSRMSVSQPSLPIEKDKNGPDSARRKSLLSSSANSKSESHHEGKGKNFINTIIFKRGTLEHAENAVCTTSSSHAEYEKPRSKQKRKFHTKPIRLTSCEKKDAKKCGNNSLALRVDLSEYAAKKRRAREKAHRIKKEIEDKKADGLTFSPTLTARRSVKVKSKLKLNNDSHTQNLKNSSGSLVQAEGYCDNTRMTQSNAVSKNSVAIASKRQCKPRTGICKLKMKMGLIVCKKKMREAGILKMGASHHFDLKAFISYARGNAKITRKLLSDHELTEIYEKDLLGRYKPHCDNSGVPMRVICEWLNIQNESSTISCKNEKASKCASPRSDDKRRLTPPTKRKSVRGQVSRRDSSKSNTSSDAPEAIENVKKVPVESDPQQLMSSISEYDAASPRSMSESL